MRRRRRQYSELAKPVSITSYIGAGLAGISILCFAATIFLSVSSAGNTGHFMGGISVLCMLLSAVCLWIGIRQFKMTVYRKNSRLVGLCIPLVATLLWLALYGIGMVAA